MIDFETPNVMGRRVPAAISELPPARATLAAPIRIALVPNSFDTRTLTLLPPTLTCTIWRTVWFEKLSGTAPRGIWGLAVQVLTHEFVGASAPAGGTPSKTTD